ncbi:acetyltransferase [Campylobacter lari]|uniref:acetyltransferase n=1 Tax=Campylobacter lari TaxID=201 RepID=UPI00215314BA|nr:acetyltransferase [Campylobacter lari]MCR6558960.1 acetyltransferase [Campylobacter lari]MCV3429706.1 acetyltransferase [Campylobacter lari]
MKKLIIIGTGETANLAYEYFTYDSDYEVIAFAVNKSYRKEDSFKSLPVINLEDIELKYNKDEIFLFVALASEKLNYNRAKIYNYCKKKGYRFASYISSKAFIWHNVEIGENCFILENNTLQPFTKIGNNVTLWSGNHIGHQTQIEDNVFITSHVVISGFCTIGENTFIGVNSSIADNIKIAKNNFIALGTVINKNTEENKIYRGNPAEPSKISAKKFCKVEE